MSSIFRERIRQSLADLNLQSALDLNAEKRYLVRKEAFASLKDPEELRQRAHHVRADVIEHLEEYLDEFTRHAQVNGMQVHTAADAEAAIRLVLEISQAHNAHLIAKSKTMVSEEIGLNHALEKQGLQVVETDLGEYIVQLRGETPSHIITPAVHLRRQDVGKLFEQKLGLPYTEEISVMTDAARRTLREVFLTADIGISGVNFGVAETGTLCVVTNEGNGRMVTTVPPVHIALMGIERLVPSLDDLALMLSLLPRSATGQKLSVYTSLLNGPRRANDPDGPQERHIILVDNGRRAVRASELSEILYCIRCGACLNACPVFREIGGHAYVGKGGKGSPYPGPIGSVLSAALFGLDEYGQLARASSLCGACREVCPVDIDLPKLLLRTRAGISTQVSAIQARPNSPEPLALGLKIYTLAAASPARFAIAQKLAGIAGAFAGIFTKGDGWMRLPEISGWGVSKDFPKPASKPFRGRFGKIAQEISGAQGQGEGQSDFPASISGSGMGQEVGNKERIQTFATELKALGGKFLTCRKDEAAAEIVEILHEHSAHQLLAWEDQNLPEGLIDELTQAGIEISSPNADSLQASSQVPVGLTGSIAGIVDTGSLVITGGAGKPLLASLLPEVHIAILRQKDLYETLAQAIRLQEIKQAQAAAIVTGPSRTADIEMTLTIGVHGPGELVVIYLRND